MFRPFLLTIFCLFLSLPAMAEDEGPAKKMYSEITKFSESLKENEMRHFFIIYNNYNLAQTVHTVKGDVSNAIDACAENNPDMAEDLRDRFANWRSKVEPALREAEDHIDNMIIAQEYAGREKFDGLFKLIDETREHTSKQFEKVPVTRKEACQHLLDTMDDTEKELLGLLKATLVTHPDQPFSGDL